MAGQEDQEPAASVGLEVSQVVELPRPRTPGGQDTARMYAVLTVTVRRAGAAHAPPAATVRDPAAADAGAAGARLAEVLLIDHSSSMVMPPSRLAAARAAAVSALARIPDGSLFALVAGGDRTAMIYPRRPGLAVAHAESRAAAEAALHDCTPGGGTAMGTWLERARQLFRELPATGDGGGWVRHALLLTDGKNEPGYETRAELQERVERCARAFACDVVGIGDAWETEELLLIARALGGGARAVADLTRLPDELASLTGRAAGRDVTGLRLRLYHRAGVRPHSFEQVHPTRVALHPDRVDLSGVGTGAGGPVEEYDLGPCGQETRAYLLCVGAPYDPAQLGKELLLTEVELDAESPAPLRLPAPQPVLMRWTDDPDLYSRLDPQVAHYRQEEELHRTFEEACAELKLGRRSAAEALLGTAWRLAAETGDTAMQEHLRRLVRVRDSASGRVELRDRIAKFDVEAARIQTSTTVLPGVHLPGPRPPGAAR